MIRSSEKVSVAVTIKARGKKHTHTGERIVSNLMTLLTALENQRGHLDSEGHHPRNSYFHNPSIHSFC